MHRALIPYVSDELKEFLGPFVQRLPNETEKRYRYFEHYLRDKDSSTKGRGDGRSAKRVAEHFDVKWEYIRTLQKDFMWTDRARLYDLLQAQDGENILLVKSPKEVTSAERYDTQIDKVVGSFEKSVTLVRRWISGQENITDHTKIDIDKLVRIMSAYERLVKNHIPQGENSPFGKSKGKSGDKFDKWLKGISENTPLLRALGLTVDDVKRLSADDVMAVDPNDVESAAALMQPEEEEEDDDGDRQVH